MTKDVMIVIRGLQATEEEQGDQVEVIVPGSYYCKNNKHFLLFQEPVEGTEEYAKSTIKLADNYMELTRKGVMSTHMVFETNKKNVTYYTTPYGSIPMGIDARMVRLEESEDRIEAEVRYLLDMNYQHVADSTIHIEVRPRNNADIRL